MVRLFAFATGFVFFGCDDQSTTEPESEPTSQSTAVPVEEGEQSADEVADPTMAFLQSVNRDLGGAINTLMAGIGDELGIFRDLAKRGPATSEALATRMDLNERYVREWMASMVHAGYLSYDRETEQVSIPDGHVPVLAEEAGPLFLGGFIQEVRLVAQPTNKLIEAFRTGGGVSQSDYHPDIVEGMERFTAAWYEHSLTQKWIPAMDSVEGRLQSGGHFADIGSGSGRALIRLAQTYPKSTFVGYDSFEPAVVVARAKAAEARVDDRVKFVAFDASTPLPEKFDGIFMFDVLHDSAKPREILASIRGALKEGGKFVLLENNAPDEPFENINPAYAALYGYSVLYCMTVSLAENGAGTGTGGFPPSVVQSYSTEAGFTSVRQVDKGPWFILYEIGI